MAEMGLFPEPKPSRRFPASALLASIALTLALGIVILGVKLARVSRERDEERRRADELLASLKRLELRLAPPACDPPSPARAPRAPARGMIEAGPETRPADDPGRPVLKVRRLSSSPGDPGAELLAAGRREFRDGRYKEAELRFFRAVPDSYVYLLLTSLVRGELQEAAGFMSRAMQADPDWFRSVVPRELFGSAGEYERVFAWLEGVVRENPLDAQAKMALAFFLYHEKGPAYAKALLVEVTNAFPDNAEASGFLRRLE